MDTNVSDTEDLFGKTIGDLQTDITVGSDGITGTLKYVDDYTGFSSKAYEQKGNYLVIRASAPTTDGVTIKAKITKEVTLDSDGIFVGRIASNTQTLTITASKEGYETVTKVYSLAGLTLESA